MLARLALVLAQLPSNPDEKYRTDPAPYIALFAVGFLLGVFGHILKVRLLVGVGVLLVFLATVLLPILQHLRY
jgi:hypothetical protein